MSPDDAPLGLPLPLTGATRIFAIIGDPIEQAGSPGLFNQAFRRHGIEAVLIPLQAPAAALPDLVATFRSSGNWDGLVVTVPHKVALAKMVDDLGPAARAMGAINAIRKAPGGRLVGDNFDGEGFLRGLEAEGHTVTDKKVLVIGAGGAGRAVAHAVAGAGARAITLVDREAEKASALAADVQTHWPSTETRSVVRGSERVDAHEVIVNCAPPAGSALPVDLSEAESTTLIVDIVLKPAWTPFLANAAGRGLATHRGIHMLSGQVEALLAFFGLAETKA